MVLTWLKMKGKIILRQPLGPQEVGASRISRYPHMTVAMLKVER
jgi:hypothetical protein